MTASSRRDYLFRRAQGKGIQGQYERKVRFLFPAVTDIDFLSLEESDAVVLGSGDDASEDRWTTTNVTLRPEQALRALGLVRERLSGVNCVVCIDEDWKSCGAFVVDDLGGMDPSAGFGDVIRDDLRFISGALEVRVDFDCYDDMGLTLVDVTVREPRRSAGLGPRISALLGPGFGDGAG